MLIKEVVNIRASGKTRDEAFKALRLMAQEKIANMPAVKEVRVIGREDSFPFEGGCSIFVRMAISRDGSVVEAIDRALSGEQE